MDGEEEENGSKMKEKGNWRDIISRRTGMDKMTDLSHAKGVEKGTSETGGTATNQKGCGILIGTVHMTGGIDRGEIDHVLGIIIDIESVRGIENITMTKGNTLIGDIGIGKVNHPRGGIGAGAGPGPIGTVSETEMEASVGIGLMILFVRQVKMIEAIAAGISITRPTCFNCVFQLFPAG